MADKAKLLIQKRTSLKAQITNLSKLLQKGRYDKSALKLRMIRVTELYHAYEEYNDELILLDPSDSHTDEFAHIQERYYSLAGKIEELTSSNTSNAVAGTSNAIAGPSNAIAGSSNDTIQHNNANAIVVTRPRIKLPEASLPNFDGRYENWLSFKNTFLAMIDIRTDLSDIEKLQYLQSALTGEAANKIKILSIIGSNYAKAWELLKRAYEVKRILISRHLSSLLNLPTLERETTDGLSRLADDAQQHVASLAALGINVGSEILVNLLESKLPRNTAEKWEESLSRDEFPKVDELYEYLYKTAVRVSKRSRTETFKREDNKESPLAKRRRTSNKTFIVNAANNCVVCKVNQHQLFKCDKFKKMSVPERIEVIKNAKLCFNCMRSHRGVPCVYTTCTICQRRHNTLLHLDRHPVTTTKTDATEKKTEKSK
ncbi:uncharacterized protein [Linepithema humile]|uniref:uncharacterized protein n=1 Tax=Linepithema humile TaxID=83485 RepID=UPI00351F3127